jgi:AraC-like DNA-binding protein
METVFSLMGLAWALMGMVYIWFGKKRGGEGLALLMVAVLCLPLIQSIVNNLILSTEQPYALGFHSIPMLFGPAFYLYTRKILNGPLTQFKTIAPHLMPFALFIFLELIVQLSTSRPLPSGSRQFPIFIYLHSAATAFSVLFYGTSIFFRINRYQKTIENHFSSRESDITLSWLKHLAGGYIILFGSSFLILLTLSPMLSLGSVSPQLITMIPLSLFVFYFSYHSAGQRIIVVDNKEDRLDRKKGKETKNSKSNREQKYEKSALNETELQDLALNLKRYMERSKVYLDSELTLEKLAKQTEIPRHKLSQVLNRELNKTFYSFVNHFRIGEFETLVKAGRHKQLSILGLAYECGFKSSSSFYNTIKKERGKTPKQIINEQQHLDKK